MNHLPGGGLGEMPASMYTRPTQQTLEFGARALLQQELERSGIRDVAAQVGAVFASGTEGTPLIVFTPVNNELGKPQSWDRLQII